jgi:hypothetical protein
MVEHAERPRLSLRRPGNDGTVQDRRGPGPVACERVFDDRDKGGIGLHRQDILGRGPAGADRGDIADAGAKFEHAEPFLHTTLRCVGLILLVTAIAQFLR